MQTVKTEINDRVSKLRNLMYQKQISAWIITGTDSHDSEYVCEHWQQREFISGFSGSAGIVVITHNRALIWVDSRYFIQCEQQIAGSCFEMQKIDGQGCSDYKDFLCKEFSNNEIIGIAGQTISVSDFRLMQSKGMNIQCFDDIVSEIWKNRPAMPNSLIWKFSDEFAGDSSDAKLSRIRNCMIMDKADYVLISSLDDIAWILNLRANDMEYTPVFYSYLLIGIENAVLFTDKNKFKGIDLSQFSFEVRDYETVEAYLGTISGVVVINPKKTCMKLFSALNNVQIIEKTEYSTIVKAQKNNAEIAGMKRAHTYDGVALIKLLSYIEQCSGFSELSLAEQLEKFKRECEFYNGSSFGTICAFAEHGAIVHYSATDESNKFIQGNNLCVLDCGSQYAFGTTDVTRTLLFGEATDEQKKHYTAVLKGHIALASAVFPQGTTGAQLDVLARSAIWELGLNYYHGTGHGVGCCLCVHENPPRISSSAEKTELKEGMIVSDEPGIYLQDRYGIRIENLLLVKKIKETEYGTFLGFEPLTLCPYESKLIDKSMLTNKEIEYINSYNRKIYEKLSSLLNPSELSKLTNIISEFDNARVIV